MLIKLAWRNVWRNKLRSAIMLCAMIFGLMGVILMVGFMNAMTSNMIHNYIAYKSGHLQIHNQAFLLNPELSATIPNAAQLEQKLRDEPTVAGVSSRQLVQGMLASANSSRGIVIQGVEPAQEAQVTELPQAIIEGQWLPLEGRNPIIVSRRNAEKFKLRIGSKVVLTFSDNAGQVTGAAFRVVGFYETPVSEFDQGHVFVRRSDLIRYSGTEAIQEMAIKLTDNEYLTSIKTVMTPLLAEDEIIRDWGEIEPMLAAMISNMGLTNLILLSVFIVAMGFGIINIMLMSVFERTRELGMLMAVGMTKPNVFKLILLETLFLGGIGGLSGIAASIVMIAITAQTGIPLGAMAEGLGAFGVDTVLYPHVSAATYLGTLAMVLVISLLAALYPAKQILKKRPVEAMTEKH